MSNYPQVSNNEHVLWEQVDNCLSGQRAQLPSSRPRKRAARCRASSAMSFRAVLLCAHLRGRKSRGTSDIKAFIHPDVYFGYSASLSGQHCKKVVKVINLQCNNHGPRCGLLMCVAKCMGKWFQRAVQANIGAVIAKPCVLNGGGMFPDEWGAVVGRGQLVWFMEETEVGISELTL